MKVAEMKKPSEEKPKFENPRMTAILIDFDWRLGHGDVEGAFREVSGCSGNGSRTLVAYAIKRLDAEGATAKADALRRESGNPAADAGPSSTTTTVDKFKEMFRRVSQP